MKKKKSSNDNDIFVLKAALWFWVWSCSICLSVFPSIHPFTYLYFTYISFYVHRYFHSTIHPPIIHSFICLLILPSTHPVIHSFIRPKFICPSIHLPIHIYLSLHHPIISLCPSIHLSICPSIHISQGSSVSPSIHPSLHISLHPSIQFFFTDLFWGKISQYFEMSVFPSIHLSVPTVFFYPNFASHFYSFVFPRSLSLFQIGHGWGKHFKHWK